MIKKVLITTICVLALNASATNNNTKGIKESSEADKVQYQKLIDDYQNYANKTPSKVKDEVVGYLQKINEIEKHRKEQKRELYKKLSEEAQSLLTKERECRKKLPFYMRSKVSLVVKDKKQENDNNDTKDKK